MYISKTLNLIKPVYFYLTLILTTFLVSCSNNEKLKSVTTEDFRLFVNETGYITDAEKYGWSIVQETVYEFKIVEGANWEKPDGETLAKSLNPVTQVSYNDAIAYCNWAKVHLPNYESYWDLIKSDNRKVHINANNILPVSEVNFVGNTWDITKTWNSNKEVRLAGGSYLCSKKSCDGTNKNRKLYVSPDTGNTHISFSVVTED